MPIDIEEFEAVERDEEKSTSELIIEYLLQNRDAAFTRGEIADAINRDPNTVGTNLSRLKDRGLVRHKKTYWAITDDLSRLAHEIRFSAALSHLTDEFGPIITSEAEAEAWSEAQPDRPHPSEAVDDDTAGEQQDAGEITDD